MDLEGWENHKIQEKAHENYFSETEKSRKIEPLSYEGR
jgi:hypothetical protein